MQIYPTRVTVIIFFFIISILSLIKTRQLGIACYLRVCVCEAAIITWCIHDKPEFRGADHILALINILPVLLTRIITRKIIIIHTTTKDYNHLFFFGLINTSGEASMYATVVRYNDTTSKILDRTSLFQESHEILQYVCV